MNDRTNSRPALDKLGQSVGGLKTQNKLLRARVKKLESEVDFLYWSSSSFYVVLILTFLARSYGWW